jgi:hypothetical protein
MAVEHGQLLGHQKEELQCLKRESVNRSVEMSWGRRLRDTVEICELLSAPDMVTYIKLKR